MVRPLGVYSCDWVEWHASNAVLLTLKYKFEFPCFWSRWLLNLYFIMVGLQPLPLPLYLYFILVILYLLLVLFLNPFLLLVNHMIFFIHL